MELKYLVTFKTIIETGSFQKAAETLHYAQSTVTFQIQQLEQELHIQLFEKIGRKMVLTSQGNDILPYVTQILQSIDQLENYSKSTQDLKGTLRVAIPETILTYLIQPVLQQFRKLAPSVNLVVECRNCYDIRDLVFHGNYDLGIHYDVGGFSNSTVVEPLSSCTLSLIASNELKDTDFLTPSQRKNICYITNDPNSIYQGIIDGYLQTKNIELSSTLQLGSIEAIKRSVASDLGISYLPTFTIEEELKNRQFQVIPLEIDPQEIGIVCTYHRNKFITPSMELFIELCKKNFSHSSL